MGATNCPTCGCPLGSGALAGLCPKCLAIGASQDGIAADAVAVLDVPPTDGASESEAPALGREGRGQRAQPEPLSDDPAGGERRDAQTIDEPIPPWSDHAPIPRIEGYDILRPLKQGGQGIVYLAVQRSTKRKVAVKLLLDGVFASKSARRRFEREIELVASLKHPNIIAVFDSGTTPDGHDYYVMDYVRGVPITQHVREKGMGVAQVLALFATVCEAANHAHQRGVIHRDLKPSNILVDVDGNVRVLDFGLAKTLTEPAESVVSVTGSVVGTFPYMSPEQTRANPDEIDTRSDVYSLGVMLYEALTGQHPYPVIGTVADVIRHICQTAPTPPAKAWTSESGVGAGAGAGRRWRPGRCPIDGDLATVLLKSLAKERERRYDSAGQFARDLRRYLAGEPIVARRPSTGYHLRVFARRHKALVGATAAVVLVLVLSLVAQLRHVKRLEAAKHDLEVANRRELEAAKLADAERIIAQQALDAMDVFLPYGADDRSDAGEFMRAWDLYTRALDRARGAGLSASATLAGMLEIASRDGGTLPLLGTYGGRGGAGGFVHAGVTKPKCVAVLRKGRLALTGGDEGQLILWDLDTGRCIQVIDTHQDRVNYVAVAPDQTWAVTAGENGTVLRWNMTKSRLLNAEQIIELPGRTGGREAVWMVAISSDGSRVIAGGKEGQIAVWERGRGQRFVGRCAESAPESAAALAFLPGDAHFAVSGDGHGNIRLWDLDAEHDPEVWKVPLRHRKDRHATPQINSLVFSADGRRMASASFDGSVAVWDAHGSGRDFRLEQRYPPIRLIQSPDRPWRVAFSDDGLTVAAAYQSGRVRLWVAESGDLVKEFRAQEEGVEGVAYLDESTLVSTGAALDPRGGLVHAALTVWDVGALVPQTFGGKITALTVDDKGVVDIKTDSGTVKQFIGRDGKLYARRTDSGPAAEPWAAADPPGAKRPTWGRAVRSTRAVVPNAGRGQSPGDQPKSVLPLPGGKAWLYIVGEELQLWGPPQARPGEAASGLVPMRVFRGHRGRITVADCSPNGRYVVSGDETGVVKVWDLLRPLRARELELGLRRAHQTLATNAANADARSVLSEWYEFCGRDAPVSGN